MRKLEVYIEIQGNHRYAGMIFGGTFQDAVFRYDKEYMDSAYGAPISVSLPFQTESFSPEQTRCFFESLLPEGFSRRAVADWIKTDERDYLTILASLGRESLGAIRIVEDQAPSEAHYEKLSASQVKALAAEGATRSTRILMETHLSLTGASGKVGLYYDPSGNWFLPKGDAPSTHIVKQSHIRLNQIVLNEQLCILTARNCGLEVPDSFIINSGEGKDEDVLYATERYDRVIGAGKRIDGLVSPLRLHQEDFSQALGIPSEQKYEKTPSGFMRRMFELIRIRSAAPIEDQKKLLESIAFNYLVGNTDCHIKNYALLYAPDLRAVRLAPSYDIVATRVYNTTSEMSFFIGGEIDINRISRDSFLRAAPEIGIGRKMAASVFDGIAERFETSLEKAKDELMEKGFIEAGRLKEAILQTGGYGRL